jgi:hypothetical protein
MIGHARHASQTSVAEFCQKFGITPEQFDALPDSKR